MLAVPVWLWITKMRAGKKGWSGYISGGMYIKPNSKGRWKNRAYEACFGYSCKKSAKRRNFDI